MHSDMALMIEGEPGRRTWLSPYFYSSSRSFGASAVLCISILLDKRRRSVLPLIHLLLPMVSDAALAVRDEYVLYLELTIVGSTGSAEPHGQRAL